MNQLRVCTFESRRGDEMAKLIERSGGVATVAPSMKEVPLEDHHQVFDFAEKLLAGEVDIVIFMTGVGTTAMFQTLEAKELKTSILDKLSSCVVVSRGPKSGTALKSMGVRIDIKGPEPNTWQDLVGELERQEVPLSGKTVAIQEYGILSTDLHEWLQTRGAIVVPVSIYNWSLPDDVGPLEDAVTRTIAGDFDVLLWTSAQQLVHVCEVAERMGQRHEWIAAAQRCFIGSIGPTCSERLREYGLEPSLEPSQPKMAHLVRESLAAASS